MEYRLSASEQGPVIAMTGRFTHADRAVFNEALASLAGQAGARVTFDLSELVFIDSAALGMLLLVREHASAVGRDIALRGARGQVEKLIALTRFSEMFLMEA